MTQPLKPMLLHKADAPPGSGYLHQIKWDGHRCLFHLDNGTIRLFTRHQIECTRAYPELQDIRLNAVSSCILDGEMIVMKNGMPCFESVMERFHAGNKRMKRQMQTNPVHFVVFDILQLDDRDLTSLPLTERYAILCEVVSNSNFISVSKCFDDGEALFSLVKEKGLEGIVSKKRDSRYSFNYRSSQWLKVKNYLFADAMISGIRKKEFGWSLVEPTTGRYLGVCEFASLDAKKAFHAVTKQLVIREDKEWIWVQPRIKIQVKFQCWSRNQLMRSPSFQKFVFP